MKQTTFQRLRFRVLNRDGFTCRYCGRAAPTVELVVDHVVPRAAGGTDTEDNLVTACVDCNAGKADLPLRDATHVAPRHTSVEDLIARWRHAGTQLNHKSARGRKIGEPPRDTHERAAAVWFEESTRLGIPCISATRERGQKTWTLQADCVGVTKDGVPRRIAGADLETVFSIAAAIRFAFHGPRRYADDVPNRIELRERTHCVVALHGIPTDSLSLLAKMLRDCVLVPEVYR
jgi:hypothetical protein